MNGNRYSVRLDSGRNHAVITGLDPVIQTALPVTMWRPGNFSANTTRYWIARSGPLLSGLNPYVSGNALKGNRYSVRLDSGRNHAVITGLDPVIQTALPVAMWRVGKFIANTTRYWIARSSRAMTREAPPR